MIQHHNDDMMNTTNVAMKNANNSEHNNKVDGRAKFQIKLFSSPGESFNSQILN